MNIVQQGRVAAGIMTVVFATGCGPQRGVTEHDRKEAAHLVSEAQFAISVREWQRAEGLLAKAVKIDPQGDIRSTWVRRACGRAIAPGPRKRIKSALKAYENDTARFATRSDPWLKRAYVLALLGRSNDARAVIEKAGKQFPNDPKVRALLDAKEFEKMVTSQNFKDMAL